MHRLITGLAVPGVTPGGVLLRELAGGVTVDQVRAATGAEPTVVPGLTSVAQVA